VQKDGEIMQILQPKVQGMHYKTWVVELMVYIVNKVVVGHVFTQVDKIEVFLYKM
jgi:hypothetical protein